MAKQMTEKQSRFVHEYVGTAGNATDAARRAGYKGSPTTLGVTGHRLLRNPNVRDKVEKQQEANRQSLIGSTEQKRAALWRIAELCSRPDEIERSEEIETLEDGTQATVVRIKERVLDAKAAIEAIKTLATMDGDLTAKESTGAGFTYEGWLAAHLGRAKSA